MRVKIERISKEEVIAWEILHKVVDRCLCGGELKEVKSMQGNYFGCNQCGNVKII